MLNISENESEDDHAISVKKFCPIRDDDEHGNTGFNDETQCSN
jgi:hypothetical protein